MRSFKDRTKKARDNVGKAKVSIRSQGHVRIMSEDSFRYWAPPVFPPEKKYILWNYCKQNQSEVVKCSVPASGTQVGGWQSHSGQSTPLCQLSNRQPAFWFLIMTKTCAMRPASKDIHKHVVVVRTLSSLYLLFSFRVFSQDEICPILIS